MTRGDCIVLSIIIVGTFIALGFALHNSNIEEKRCKGVGGAYKHDICFNKDMLR